MGIIVKRRGEQMKFNNSQQAFIALMQAGLWERETGLASFNPIDYTEILHLAEVQMVTGLVAAGVEHVVDCKIPQEDLLQITEKALQIERRSKAVDEFVEHLIKTLREKSVYTLLIKGQGIAQCYERPQWRTCGDIDLLFSKDNYEAAKSLLTQMASSVGEEDVKRKHLALTIDNWVIVLHGTLRTDLRKRIDGVLDSVLDDVFYSGSVRSWVNGKTLVFLPRADEDVILVFARIFRGFHAERIELLQICDWCRLLYTYRDKIDRRLLEKRLKAARMMGIWKVFATVAVEYLGMPSEAMPFYKSSRFLRKKAEMVLALVMDAGNTSQGKDRNHRGMRFLKAIWLFCSYLFVPQWGRNKNRISKDHE